MSSCRATNAKPINTDAIRFEADAEIQICQRSGQSAHPSVYLARTLSYEIDRLRADVAAMLPIVEAVAKMDNARDGWTGPCIACHRYHADGCDPGCVYDRARRFLDARKVGP